MEKVFFATTNDGKAKTLAFDLSLFNIGLEHVHLAMPEARTDDLAEIAKDKVIFAFNHIKKPCIANDSGFYLHAWNGFPRAFVNFELATLGNRGILKLIVGEDRSCHFKSCFAFYDGKEVRIFESETHGIIAEKERGVMKANSWSKHYLIFIPDGKSKTLAEMTDEEFNAWRKERMGVSAVGKFAEWYLKQK